MAARSKTVDVVVTIKPIHSLVSQVMEGAGAPVLLVEGAASPHSFSLKPSQVRAINAAGVFIRVSERLEPFTGKIVRSLPNDVVLITLIDVPGINLLEQRRTGAFDPHEHTHAHVDDDPDSHIWLDPENAKVIARYVAVVLGKRYPQHASLFAANAERLVGEIDGLAQEIAEE
ncbi:MAG TPA: zinc ABC transporter substrate-binding protein, partial [Hyphomicrobium sp.]|nr:zinc ABC transporter substrate-binding protein [Hyphomicrobium sp.]